MNIAVVPLKSSTVSTTISASGSYTWANNGQTYTSSGTYSGNVVNCVAQVLNLTITPLVTVTQYTISIASVTSTANTMDVTLTVTATNPSPGVRFGGFAAGINFSTATINGGTISAVYLGGRSAALSNLPANAINVLTAGHIRLATASLSGAQGVDMLQGTSLTLGTYRISNTANWTSSSNANLWLQNVVSSGKTNSAVIGYPYGQTTPAFTYTTTAPASALSLSG